MVWSFQHDPDGPLFGLFAHRIYGKTTALEYLWKESLNRQAHGWLEQIEELADKWNIKRK